MTRGPECDIKAAKALVSKEIPGSSMSRTKNELIFNLPVNQVGKFPELFEELDREKNNLNVFNIGLKVTTMEDVFLK